VNAMSMYTQGLQVLAERFHYHCVQAGERGVIVVDRRTRNLDFQVAASHLSYIFGNPVGRAYTTLVEAPMFVDSVLSAGIQLADLVGSCIYGCYYHRRCATLPGVFVGNQLVTQDQFDANPAGPWTSRTPAHDYSHCHQFWPKLTALQFSEDRRSPSWTGRDGVWLLGLPRVDVTSGRRVISERSGGTPTAARPRAPRQAPRAALVTSLGTVAPAEEPGGGAPRDPDSSFSVLPSGLG